MSVDIVDRQGVKSHAEGIFSLDGTPSRATGSLDVDIASFRMPSRHVLVMGAGMGGNPGNTRVFVVSEDGKSMTETIVSHGPGNVPATRVNDWTKK